MSALERMTTRRKRLDYRALNDGSDDEAAPEDRIASSTMSAPLLSSQSAIDGFINIPDDEVLPSESASQLWTGLELKCNDTGLDWTGLDWNWNRTGQDSIYSYYYKNTRLLP
ncbi:hypothetical protein V1506DRAFT_541696 [Lipomyces tetrasporus]